MAPKPPVKVALARAVTKMPQAGAQPGTLLFEPKWDDYLVCAAVIGSLTQPQAIVAGLPVNGQLRIVGRSTVLSTRTGRELGRQLRPAQPGHPWPEEISETSLNRFSKDKGPVHLTLIEPLVVEVAADVAWSGTSFRHPLTYQRARPELDPADVELPPYIKAR